MRVLPHVWKKVGSKYCMATVVLRCTCSRWVAFILKCSLIQPWCVMQIKLNADLASTSPWLSIWLCSFFFFHPRRFLSVFACSPIWLRPTDAAAWSPQTQAATKRATIAHRTVNFQLLVFSCFSARPLSSVDIWVPFWLGRINLKFADALSVRSSHLSLKCITCIRLHVFAPMGE